MIVSKNNKIVFYFNIFVITIFALISVEIKAQDYSTTGYFNDGYVYKHKLNPAATPNQSYIAVPALGGVYAGANSNLSYSSFLYPELANGGKIPTLLSPSIHWTDIEKKFANVNPLRLNADVNLFSAGFHNAKGTVYTTVDADLKLGVRASLPKEIFAMLKIGEKGNLGNALPLDKSYQINNLKFNLGAHAQIAVGQSYSIGSMVKVGYKVKYLTSFASADMNLNQLNVQFKKPAGVDEVTMHIKGDGNMYTMNIPVKYAVAPERGISIDTDALNPKNIASMVGNAFGSFGFAADLGIVVDIYDWLQVSASVNDLGVMTYKKVQNGALKADSGDIIINPTGSDIKKEDLLNDLLNFQAGDPATMDRTSEMMACTAHAGVQVRIPQYQKVSFGALYSQQFDKDYGWWEIRGSVNYDVVKIFSVSAAYAYGKFGSQLGALASVHFTGFNFFLGVDNIPFQYTTKMIPFDSANVAIHTGITFLFGKYHGRYGKK